MLLFFKNEFSVIYMYLTVVKFNCVFQLYEFS